MRGGGWNSEGGARTETQVRSWVSKVLNFGWVLELSSYKFIRGSISFSVPQFPKTASLRRLLREST